MGYLKDSQTVSGAAVGQDGLWTANYAGIIEPRAGGFLARLPAAASIL